MRLSGVRTPLLLILCLLLAGATLRASDSGPPKWPYASRPCAETPTTPVPASFEPPVILGGDVHTNITAVAIGLLGSRPVAISAGEERTLRVWDLPGLAPIGRPVELDRTITAIGESVFAGQPLKATSDAGTGPAVGRMNGRTVRVTADDELHVIDAASGREVGPKIELGEDNEVKALQLITLNGRLTAVINDTGGDEDEEPDPLRFWDLATGRRITGIDGDFTTVRKTRVNGRTVLLAVDGPTGNVSIWDAASRKRLGLLPAGRPPGALVHLAVGELDGRPIALTGGGDNALRLWDLTTAGQLAATAPSGHTETIKAITVTHASGRTVAITKGDDRTIQWDLATRRRIDDVPPKTYDSIEDIPPDRLRGRDVLLEEWPGGVRFRDLIASSRSETDRAFSGRKEVYVTRVGGRTVLFGRNNSRGKGRRTGDARVWIKDAYTGVRIGAPVNIGARTPLSLTTLADIDGRPVLLVSLKRRTRILDFRTGRLLASVKGVSSSESPIAVGHVRCTTGVLTERGGDTVHFWDLRTGRRLTPPLRGHTARVHRILSGRLGDIPIAVTATYQGEIRVWNLVDGRQIGDPLKVRGSLDDVALGYVNGHTVLLAGGRAEQVLMWDLSA